MHPNKFESAAAAKAFVLAGNATITLRSLKTETHLTFRIRQPKGKDVHFVSVLTGSDNESNYTFLGTIFPNGTYKQSHKSKIGDAISAAGFDWFWKAMQHDVLPDTLQVWHEGSCGRCGRKLTVPESIASGIGPECAKKVRPELPNGELRLSGDMSAPFGPRLT